MRETVEFSAVVPPRSSNEPRRYCMNEWESTMPVVVLSRMPASARTSGSRCLPCSVEMKRVSTLIDLLNLWSFSRSAISDSSCATIHLPVLRCGIFCLSQSA